MKVRHALNLFSATFKSRGNLKKNLKNARKEIVSLILRLTVLELLLFYFWFYFVLFYAIEGNLLQRCLKKVKNGINFT